MKKVFITILLFCLFVLPIFASDAIMDNFYKTNNESYFNKLSDLNKYIQNVRVIDGWTSYDDKRSDSDKNLGVSAGSDGIEYMVKNEVDYVAKHSKSSEKSQDGSLKPYSIVGYSQGGANALA